jgi:hypothetical protein
MFSFHRPKVYRSSTGCCICKAKSSSSRFTDSKKYEEDFMKCFKLAEPRQGEICNACVLLVKRWKKLPAGSDRNWKHVSTTSKVCVDFRREDLLFKQQPLICYENFRKLKCSRKLKCNCGIRIRLWTREPVPA